MNKQQQFFTVSEAAELIGLPNTTLHHLIYYRRLVGPPEVRVGGKRLAYDAAGFRKVTSTVGQLLASGKLRKRIAAK